MSIVNRLPVSSMLGDPFTDYLNVTVPQEYGCDVQDRLVSLIESLCHCSEQEPGTFRLFNERLEPTSAVFRFKKRGKVRVISASGMALDALRHYRVFDEYLAILSEFPHRVSMLHATADYLVPSPGQVIRMFKDAAYAEQLALTRKAIKRGQVRALLNPDKNGEDTGTVYLGDRANADVWCKIYDKQNERLHRAGYDPGPIVRVELCVQSDVGATLRDAHCPYGLFFQFAGKTLVERPEGFQEWSPQGEGYVLGGSREVLPLDRLDRLLEYSLDLRRLVEIAKEAYGEKAGDVLSRLIRKKCVIVPEIT